MNFTDTVRAIQINGKRVPDEWESGGGLAGFGAGKLRNKNVPFKKFKKEAAVQ